MARKLAATLVTLWMLGGALGSPWSLAQDLALQQQHRVVKILIYFGHGSKRSSADYSKLKDFYEALGVTVDDTTLWPTSLESYRVIILVAPTEEFNNEQVDALQKWLRRYHRLLVLGEYKEFIGDQTAINILLAELGVGIRLKDNANADLDNDTCEPLLDIAKHPLTKGLREAGGLDPSKSATLEVFGNAQGLVRIHGGQCGTQPMRLVGEPVCAVGKPQKPRRRGEVVVCGDTNLFDSQFGFSDPAHDGIAGNQRFACNLVQPFLRQRRLCDTLQLPLSAASPPAATPTTAEVKLHIFDLHGRLVATVSDAQQGLALDRLALPNGIYLVVMTLEPDSIIPRRRWIQKVVILR